MQTNHVQFGNAAALARPVAKKAPGVAQNLLAKAGPQMRKPLQNDAFHKTAAAPKK